MIQIFFKILSLFFTFVSFIAITDTKPWTSLHMEAFAFLAVFCLYLSSYKRNTRISLDSRFYFLAALAIASCAFYFLRDDAFYETLLSSLLYIFTCILLLSANISNDKELIKQYFIVIVFATLANIFLILLQQFDITEFYPIKVADYSQSQGRPYANFGQPNLAATFVLTGALCAYYLHEQKTISYSTALLIACAASIALAYSSSRTAFLSIIIILIYSTLKKNYKISLLSGVVGLGIIITTSATKIFSNGGRELIGNDLSNGRMTIWLEMFDAISQAPWIGYGIMNTRAADFAVRELHPNFVFQANGSSHNIYIDLIVWLGLPIGLLISALMTNIAVNHIKNSNNNALLFLPIPIAIHSLLEYPLYFSNFLFLFVFVLSAVNYNSKLRINSAPFFMAAITLFMLITFDYSKILMDYTALRYYKNNFVGAEKPSANDYKILDITGGQLNAFIIDRISTDLELVHIQELTKHSPTVKNFILILAYLKEHDRGAEYLFWKTKASAYLVRDEQLKALP